MKYPVRLVIWAKLAENLLKNDADPWRVMIEIHVRKSSHPRQCNNNPIEIALHELTEKSDKNVNSFNFV